MPFGDKSDAKFCPKNHNFSIGIRLFVLPGQYTKQIKNEGIPASSSQTLCHLVIQRRIACLLQTSYFGCFVVVGESAWKTHTSRMGRVSKYLVTKNARRPTKIISLFFSTSISSPILIFCPQIPRSHLFKLPKHARRNMTKIHLLKKCVVPHGAIGWTPYAMLTLKTNSSNPHQLSPKNENEF